MLRTDNDGPVEYQYQVTKAGASLPDTIISVAQVPGRGVTDTIAYIIQSDGDILLQRPAINGGRCWLRLPFGTGAESVRHDTITMASLSFVTTGTRTGSGTETVGSESLQVQRVTLRQVTTDMNGLSTENVEHLCYAPSLNLFVADSLLATSSTMATTYRLLSHSLKN